MRQQVQYDMFDEKVPTKTLVMKKKKRRERTSPTETLKYKQQLINKIKKDMIWQIQDIERIWSLEQREREKDNNVIDILKL